MNKRHIFHLDGHILAAETFDSDKPGIPIILIHGVMSSLNFWTPDILALFSPYGPCTSLNLPGHYPSQFRPGFSPADLTPEWLAHHLAEAIRQISGGVPALLVGHSTGGYAVLDLAAKEPDLAAGLISISGFARGRWSMSLRRMQRLSLHEHLGGWVFSALYALGGIGPFYKLTAPIHTPLPPDFPQSERQILVEENLQNFRQFDPKAMQTWFAAMLHTDITPLLPAVRVPALIIAGEHDPAVPPAQASLIAARIPTAQKVIIPGAGHHPFYEQPRAFRSAVRDWLQTYFPLPG